MSASRMPAFDQAIERHHTDQVSRSAICSETGRTFELVQADLELYRSLKICIPRLSPDTRFRRTAARVGGFELYKREVDGQEMISMFDPESPAKIIPATTFYSDAFDGISYGRSYVASQSFLEQWKAFSFAIPHPAIIQDTTSENSPWAVYDFGFKNCYFTYGGLEMSDSCYADLSVSCNHVVDVVACFRSEWCYECVACAECSQMAYSERCEACQRVFFSADCYDCKDCFGCINLRKKQYCFLNEQLDEVTYKTRLASIDLRDPKVVAAWRERVRTEVWNVAPRKACSTYTSERSTGDEIVSCKDVEGVGLVEVERSRSSYGLSVSRDCVDMLTAVEAERCASGMFGVNNYECVACVAVQSCVQVEYSEFMYACEQCFGCIGLRHKKFCLFNIQYTEEAYWKLVDQIKTCMVEEGTYGEPLPYDASLFAYNGSFALAIDPLNETEAKRIGARWYRFPEMNGTRPFRTVKPEIELIETLGVALPTEHPTMRRLRRMKDLQPFTLIDRICDQCQVIVRSRYRPSVVEKVLCEKCYEERLIAQ